MFVRIEVALRTQYRDLVGETILASLRREGLAQATGVHMARVYHFSGLTGRGGSDWRSAAASLGRTLLADPVAEKFAVDEPAVEKGFSGIVEVARKPGVMDPVEASLIKALSDAGCHADVIRTSKRYYLFGPA
ncbi:MAG: phosphoribosylformylglycinamidine synthase subunit PurS, partial [Candidatus Brocadiia bacterium]